MVYILSVVKLMIIHCKTLCVLENREGLCEILEEQLLQINTHTDLVTIIKQDTHSVLARLLIDVIDHPDVDLLQDLLQLQNNIGWFPFLMVFWCYCFVKYRCITCSNDNFPDR